MTTEFLVDVGGKKCSPGTRSMLYGFKMTKSNSDRLTQ